MRSILSRIYIKVDTVKILAFLITLHGLLCESNLTLRPYIYNFKDKTIICIFIVWLLAFFQNKVYIKNIAYLMVPCLVGLYTATTLNNENLGLISLLLFFCVPEMLEKIIAVVYKTTKLFFWIHAFLFLLYRLSIIGLTDYVLVGESGVRYSFFTIHPNYIARIFIFYIALYCYVKKLEIKNLKWILILSFTVLMYYFTKSDALYIVFVCFLISKIKDSSKVDKCLTILVKYGVPIFLIFSLSSAWGTNIPVLNNMLEKLNILMSHRLTSNLKALALYGVTLFGKDSKFGQHFVYQGVEYSYIYADNMYIYMLVHLGLIYLILLALVLYRAADLLDFLSKAMIVVLLLYGIGESGVTALYTAFSLLLAYSAIINKEKTKLSFYFDERKI